MHQPRWINRLSRWIKTAYGQQLLRRGPIATQRGPAWAGFACSLTGLVPDHIGVDNVAALAEPAAGRQETNTRWLHHAFQPAKHQPKRHRQTPPPALASLRLLAPLAPAPLRIPSLRASGKPSCAPRAHLSFRLETYTRLPTCITSSSAHNRQWVGVRPASRGRQALASRGRKIGCPWACGKARRPDRRAMGSGRNCCDQIAPGRPCRRHPPAMLPPASARAAPPE